MLSLQLKTGDYMTIGENVVVQLDRISGDRCKLMIQAPRNGPAGSARTACSTARAITGRRFSGTGTSPRHWPPCGGCWARWTAKTRP